MVNLLKHLNNKIIINDLIIKNIKYEINMLMYESASKEKAIVLAERINKQLDSALVGIPEDDKDFVRRELIKNSFLVVPNPVSDKIHYGHVFTTLTNMKPSEHNDGTKKRLSHWLNLNTEVSYDEESLNQYITQYRVTSDPSIKVAAIQYVPKQSQVVQPAISDDVVYKYRLKKNILWIPVTIITLALFIFYPKPISKDISLNNHSTAIPSVTRNYTPTVVVDEINPFEYTPIKFRPVYEYLKNKNSALTHANYISLIDRRAKEFNINPLLLIAIIGHEQNFVPADHESVDKIINNPYNVFGSWELYNTDFEDATDIALRTIETAINSKPQDQALIEWLNQTYAEDENWSIGVTLIFTKLQSLN